jgi:hypothetical protein
MTPRETPADIERQPVTREQMDRGEAVRVLTFEGIGCGPVMAVRLARALLAALDDLDAVKAELRGCVSALKDTISERDALQSDVDGANEIYGAMLDAQSRAEAAEAANAALTARNAALVGVLNSFRLNCNEASFYKDCAIQFMDPHSLMVRIPVGSDKAFIVADLEARRRAALQQKDAPDAE